MALLSDLLLAALVASFCIGAAGALLLGSRPAGRFVAALGAGSGALAALALGLRMLVADAAPSSWSSVNSANVVELFKMLEGTWKGKATAGSVVMDSTVAYKVTGAGSAVMETMISAPVIRT